MMISLRMRSGRMRPPVSPARNDSRRFLFAPKIGKSTPTFSIRTWDMTALAPVSEARALARVEPESAPPARDPHQEADHVAPDGGNVAEQGLAHELDHVMQGI